MSVSILDTLIAWWVMILAMLPFGEIFLLRPSLGLITAYDIPYIVLVCLLVTRIIVHLRLRFVSPLILFMGTAAFSTGYAVMYRDVPIAEAIRSLRVFSPFFVAALVLAAGFRYPAGKFLGLMVFATLASSSIAFYAKYVAPELLNYLWSRSVDIHRLATESGRLYWGQECLFFFVLLTLYTKDTKVPIWVRLLTLLISTAAFFCTSTRTSMIGAVVFLGAAAIVSTESRIIAKRAGIAGAVIVISVLAGLVVVRFDTVFSEMVNKRLFGDGEVKSLYTSEVAESRYPLYDIYAEIVRESFLLGQGIGVPFYDNENGVTVGITDVAIMSFVLPFGILGLFTFGNFLWVLSRLLFKGDRSLNWEERKLAALMLGTFFLMGFNYDFFSRNNFVIFFTCFAFTVAAESDWQGAEHKQVVKKRRSRSRPCRAGSEQYIEVICK